MLTAAPKSSKIESALRTFFPNGTTGKSGDDWNVMPDLATDVFAFAAHLIERGGVYHRLIIEKSHRPPLGPPWTNGKNLILKDEEITCWSQVGREWGGRPEESGSTKPRNPALMQAAYRKISDKYWQPLIGCASTFSWGDIQTWGRHAFALLVIADEASQDLGYQLDNETLAHPIEEILREAWFVEPRTEKISEWHEIATKALPNFASVASYHVARVVPKSRTPVVGNTMRTL